MGRQPNDKDSLGDRPPPESSERERLDSIRQYLLGELSEDGQEQVEKRLLSEDDYFEELLIAEEELTDDFVGDRLPNPERTKFSHRFLSIPELRQDVTFARALRTYASQNAPRVASRAEVERPPPFRARLAAFFQQPAVGFSLAAALLLAVCLVAWMVTQNRRLRAEVEHLQATQTTPTPTPQTGLQEQLALERERGDQLAAQLRQEQEQRANAERNLEEARRQKQQQPPPPQRDQESRPVVATLITLTPGLIRGSGAEWEEISAPPPGTSVIAHLDLASDDYRTYHATLKTLEGRALLSLASLRALAIGKGKVVPVTLPARVLVPENDYQILLSGKAPNGRYEEIGAYYFRVVR